jgi:hypothetical protein
MEKKLSDYIQYYIGCDVIIDGREHGKLLGGMFIPNSVDQIYYDIQTEEMRIQDGDDFSMPYNDDPFDSEPRIKPILRRLEDVTDDEWQEIECETSVAPDAIKKSGPFVKKYRINPWLQSPAKHKEYNNVV